MYSPIDSLSDPAFLLVYLGWIVLVLTTSAAVKYFGFLKGSERSFPIPEKPDPYTIAYLRAPNETISLATVSLIQQGLLIQDPDLKTVKRSELPQPESLHPLELLTLKRAGTKEISVQALLRSPGLIATMTKHFKKTQGYFGHNRLIVPKDERWPLLRISTIFLVLSLGILKIIAAADQAHSKIGLLVALMFASFIASFLVTRPARVTRDGKRFLANLHRAFATPGPEAMDHQSLMLAFATGGASVLKWSDNTDLKPSFFTVVHSNRSSHFNEWNS